MTKYIVLDPALLRKLVLSGLFLGILFTLSSSQMAAANQCYSLECLLLFSYGHVEIEGIMSVLPVLFWLAPQIVLLYFLGDWVAGDLERNVVYIFTRTTRRKTWWVAKVSGLFFYVFLYYAIQLLAVCIIGGLLGYTMAGWYQGMILIGSEMGLLLFLNYLILLLINLLSLRWDVVLSAMIIVGGNVSSLFFAYLIHAFYPEKIIQWLPFTQGILTWHTDAPKVNDSVFVSLQLENYNILFSIIYLGMCCVVSIAAGMRKVERMDIL